MNPPRFRAILFTALLFLFGLHCMRAFLPSVIWFLSEAFPVEMLALYAFGTFALVFFAPLLRRRFGDPGALLFAGTGMVASRAALQFSSLAALDLAFSTAGVVFFLWLLPLVQQSAINRPRTGEISAMAVSVPLALIVDVSSRTLLWSYDLTWRRSSWAITIVLVLAIFAMGWLWLDARTWRSGDKPGEPSLLRSLPFAGLGAWMFLVQNLLFNPQALGAAAGWVDRPSHLLVNLLAFIGAIVSVWVAVRAANRNRFWPVMAALVLIAGLTFTYLRIYPVSFWLALAAIGASACIGWVLENTAQVEHLKPGLWRTSLAAFLAFLTLLVAVLMTEYDINWIIPVTGCILAVFAVWSAYSRRRAPVRDGNERPLFSLVAGAGLIALVAVDIWASNFQPPQPIEVGTGQPIKVMTYNIHQGLNAGLHLDMEEIAQAIAEQNPDVISLNEINRARASNGYVDTLLLLSRRLNMPYVFGANFADGQYGNAILSRYPILEWENRHYSANTTEVRGLLRVKIDLEPEPIIVFSTHLDHIGSPENARSAQIAEALRVWGSVPRTLIMGDFNASPRATELVALYQTPLVDLLAASGQDTAFTFWNPPDQRIDYIFATPDLAFTSVQVIPNRASDHLPVVAIIYP